MLPNLQILSYLFKILGDAGRKLESKCEMSEIKRGECIYGLYGVIDPDHASKGYSLKFWWNLFAIGKLGGWKYYYSRIDNAIKKKK